MNKVRYGSVVCASLVLGFMLSFLVPTAVAQNFPFMQGMVRGATRGHAIPAYLKSKNYSSTTASTIVHNGAAVLGCVVINTAGAASSTIKLYNSNSVVAAYLMATIDATQVGRQFCYGNIYSGAILIAIASGGASPDVTITYQGPN